MFKLDYAVASDRGLVRDNNEDSAYAGPHLLALADGMGGHAAGEIASQIMINFLRSLDQDPQDNDMLALLGSGADEANSKIAEAIVEAPETQGMGTTLTALMFNGTEFGMCHVGDSRGYLLRDGKLRQITVDDTYVQSLVHEGKLDPEDVFMHPMRSMILKAYSGTPVEPTLEIIPVQVGDRVLLCSDGLSDPVAASTIETTLLEGTPAQAAQRLVELALRSGGPDNVTVVVADVVEGSSERTLPPEPLLGGALLGAIEEDPRPDTAAGRAAMLIQKRQPQAIAPQVPNQAEGEAEPEALDTSPKRGKFLVLIVALTLLIALIGAGWWGFSRLQNSFYVTTSPLSNELVIEQGVNMNLLGRELHSTYQRACLSPTDELTMIPVDSTAPCHHFTLTDLDESARAEVSTLPRGDYDQALQQMQTLASKALPLCVTREGSGSTAQGREPASSATASAVPTSTRQAAQSSTAAAAPASSSAASVAASEGRASTASTASTASSTALGDLTSPGLNCREVD
ncbi:protein phosphatase 2C domain-containing protein [Corynebacterium sp. 35RC1]|nr:protein phosphatase 2C domain-containing protein [Corynebacterium sp. 35RC1]